MSTSTAPRPATDTRTVLVDSIKQLITLSSAALTLSVAFVSDLAGGSVDGYAKVLLQLSWILLLISLVSGLGALFTIVNLNEANTLPNAVLRSLVGGQQGSFVLSFVGLVIVACEVV